MLAPKTDEIVLSHLMKIMTEQKWTLKSNKALVNLFNICDSRSQQELLTELILRFEVLNGAQESEAYTYINDFIQKNNLSPETTLIVGCGDVGRSMDGSFVGLQRMKNRLEPRGQWEDRISQNISDLMLNLKNNTTVIIFDDFIGSGNKIIGKYEWLKESVAEDDEIKFDSLKVVFASLAAMNFGIERVKKETNCEVISYLCLKKGITEHYPATEVTQKLLLMGELEAKLHKFFDSRLLSKYSLGYLESEALYFAENDNCPNNVFPIFWWQKLTSDETHETLLYRSD